MAAGTDPADPAADPAPPPQPATGRGRGWYRGDCHMHSQRSSGGEFTPAQLATAARAVGLDFITATEHNTADTHDAWRALAADDLVVILGQEVVTGTGHWLAIGIGAGHLVDWRYGVRDDLIDRALDRVHRAGGLCVAAHPHAPYPSGVLMYPFEKFDMVEVWNGRWRSDLPWNADNEAALAEWGRGLAAGIHAGRWLPAIGNSDVHMADQIGTPQTVVLAEELSADAVLAGIRAGHSWIAESAGVDLSFTVRAGDRSAGIGDRLATSDEPSVALVTVEGVPAGTVSVHTERGRAHHQRLPGAGPGTVEWHTSGRESGFVRIEVRRPDGHMAALTNPIILA